MKSYAKGKIPVFFAAVFLMSPAKSYGDSNIRHGRVRYVLSRCAKTLLTKERYEFSAKKCPITIKMHGKNYRADIGNLEKPFVQNTFIRNDDGTHVRHDRNYALFRGELKRGKKVFRASGKGRRYRIAAYISGADDKITIDFTTPRFAYQTASPLKKILKGRTVRLNRTPRVLYGKICPVEGVSSLEASGSFKPPALPAVPPSRSVVFTRADYDDNTASSESDPESYVAGVMNAAAAIYLDQLGMELNVFTIVGIGDVLGNSSDPITLINNYQTFRAGLTTSSVLQHLVTTGALTDPVIGIAFQGTVCVDSDFAVGISSKTEFNGANVHYRVAAHEIGHNFNATHDDNSQNLMSSVINSSDQFTQFSISEIESFVGGAGGSCLSGSGTTPPTGDDDDDNGGGTPGDDDDDSGGGSGGGGGVRPGDNTANAGVLLRGKSRVVLRKDGSRQGISLFFKWFGSSTKVSNCGSVKAVGIYAAPKKRALMDPNDLSKATIMDILDMSGVPEGVFTRLRAVSRMAREGKNLFFVRAVVSCTDSEIGTFKAASRIIPVKLYTASTGKATGLGVIKKFVGKFGSQ